MSDLSPRPEVAPRARSVGAAQLAHGLLEAVDPHLVEARVALLADPAVETADVARHVPHSVGWLVRPILRRLTESAKVAEGLHLGRRDDLHDERALGAELVERPFNNLHDAR